MPAPPLLSGWTPLGCALAYRRDPAGFLREQRARHGPVFTLDLAGLAITLAADLDSAVAVQKAPEDRLGARAAQADFGFETMLGRDNVFRGTDVHHDLLTRSRRLWAADLRERLTDSARAAVAAELSASDGRFEALTLLRRAALRVTVAALVDPRLVERRPDFLDRFMRFQDRLEEATSRAMALPRFIAQPLVLAPIERERLAIVGELLAPALAASTTVAPYLSLVRERLGQDDAWRVTADVVVGLLFAAHKNAAIGAAQALMFLLPRPEHFVAARDDGEHLERCLQETLRLCAHPIGSLRRVVGEPFELRGFQLPVGAYVGASHLLIGADPARWPEPERFDPERFRQPQPAWVPFSGGPHGCPGQRVAMDLMRALLDALFEAAPRLDAETVPPLDFQRATLAQPAGPAWVRWERRAAA